VIRTYQDPFDRIWLTTAERIGFSVRRTDDAYASSDGRGTILIGSEASLDDDDSLAQLVFHEMCHALVEGEAGLAKVDWGLDNTSDRDLDREWACLRLQVALSAPHGLRRFFAPTTDHRTWFDTELGDDPLVPWDDPSVIAARLGLGRAERRPWAPHLSDALAATAEVVKAAARFAHAGSLYATVEERSAEHPLGLPLPRAGTQAAHETCGSCVWLARERGSLRCRRVPTRKANAAWSACERWESPSVVDCQTCAACCRDAYHSVTVPARDPVVKRHPSLVIVRDRYVEIVRDGDRCAALGGGSERGDTYACTIYDDRPRPCREFERAGPHCLEARRRVGLSR
jgi:hypothetical protein